MSRLYTYVVRFDGGLAPNPFWGWCTLAVCTPNHQGSRIEAGDWIAGFFDKDNGHRFLYAMEVAEGIDMNRYFKDERFAAKRPRIRGTWMQRCGDNFYSQHRNGDWKQHRTPFHTAADLKRDTKHPFVFAATRFWYLGQEANRLPRRFRPLAGGRGARVNHPPEMVDQFKSWVIRTFSEGVAALPRDMERCSCGVGGTPTTQNCRP